MQRNFGASLGLVCMSAIAMGLSACGAPEQAVESRRTSKKAEAVFLLVGGDGVEVLGEVPTVPVAEGEPLPVIPSAEEEAPSSSPTPAAVDPQPSPEAPSASPTPEAVEPPPPSPEASAPSPTPEVLGPLPAPAAPAPAPAPNPEVPATSPAPTPAPTSTSTSTPIPSPMPSPSPTLPPESPLPAHDPDLADCARRHGVGRDRIMVVSSTTAMQITGDDRVVAIKLVGNQSRLDLVIAAQNPRAGGRLAGLCIFLAGNQSRIEVDARIDIGMLYYKGRGNLSAGLFRVAAGATLDTLDVDLAGNQASLDLLGDGDHPCDDVRLKGHATRFGCKP